VFISAVVDGSRVHLHFSLLLDCFFTFGLYGKQSNIVLQDNSFTLFRCVDAFLVDEQQFCGICKSSFGIMSLIAFGAIVGSTGAIVGRTGAILVAFGLVIAVFAHNTELLCGKKHIVFLIKS
jgi:hypothetical protein